jgi:hypothetical protein
MQSSEAEASRWKAELCATSLPVLKSPLSVDLFIRWSTPIFYFLNVILLEEICELFQVKIFIKISS